MVNLLQLIKLFFYLQSFNCAHLLKIHLLHYSLYGQTWTFFKGRKNLLFATKLEFI